MVKTEWIGRRGRFTVSIADLSAPSFSSPITPDFFDQTQHQDAM